ncbi:hypothetical protein NOJ05_19540 [Neorhizobium galegae]|uniref:hypothetical protein n=1 Tax=Neorhizobium galegae TaxID=399 RepID=UPI002106ADAB|nr:hypothetical protein [Neorhizobium galegae]MCQ1779406.1 hypothetical protein [Neorhizobium galegae]MCQ1795566.1 hypothetical protein [Neorhizobium galegae]
MAEDEFTAILAVLFERLGFETTKPAGFSDHADLVVSWQGHVDTVIIVKQYRSRIVQMSDIYRASAEILHQQKIGNAEHALLITNVYRRNLPPVESLPEGVFVVAVEDLVRWASPFPNLLDHLIRFDSQLAAALKDFEQTPLQTSSLNGDILRKIKTRSGDRNGKIQTPERVGHDLAALLLSIPADEGRKICLASGDEATPWRLLEIIGQRALEYAFEGSLTAWQPQGRIGDEMDRTDVLAKIIGSDVFSRTLVADFRTRYVLFDFKNSSTQLTSNVVHIAEKYLYPTALRSTAIMISPKGFSPSARRSAFGALRETGRLVLDLTVEQLASMTKNRDSGTTPDAAMEESLDRFLQQVAR